MHDVACRSFPAFAGISASNPFGIGASKGSDAADKQQSGEEQKAKGGKEGKDGDAKAKAKALADNQKEERHRKDDAAGRSNHKEQQSDSDRDRDKGHESRMRHQKEREARERASAEGQKGGGGEPEEKTTMHANVARGLVGIWREFNEEDPPRGSGRSSDDDARQESDVPKREGEGIVPDDSGPVARIVAYSDSDSDEPMPLPFQKQRDKGTAEASDAENDEAAVASAPEASRKRRWPWRSHVKHKPTEEVPLVCSSPSALLTAGFLPSAGQTHVISRLEAGCAMICCSHVECGRWG